MTIYDIDINIYNMKYYRIITYFILLINNCMAYFNPLKGIKTDFLLNKNLPILYHYSNNIKQLSLEHVFPKSYMYKEHHNDLHNIYTASKLVNNMRSNYKFINENDYKYVNNMNDWKRIEGNNYVNNKNRLFIPKNIDKGIISRSILYMCYKYSYSAKNIIDINTLINWCMEYKPTEYEKNHNIYVMNMQNNINKFILYYDDKRILNRLINNSV